MAVTEESHGWLYGLLLGLGIGILLTASILGHAYGAPGDMGTTQSEFDETPTVSCLTYIDDDGNASGMCFISGDVRFRWLDDADQNMSNGTVSFWGEPANNSTVRKEE